MDMGVKARFLFNNIGDGVLNAIVARFPHCRAVVLTGLSNRVTDPGIAALASGCPQLRELDVKYPEKISIPALTTAIEQLERFESLVVPRDADLSGEDGAALAAVLASKPGLQKLKIRNAKLGPHLPTILTFARLTDLNLYGCHVGHGGAFAIADFLKTNTMLHTLGYVPMYAVILVHN